MPDMQEAISSRGAIVTPQALCEGWGRYVKGEALDGSQFLKDRESMFVVHRALGKVSPSTCLLVTMKHVQGLPISDPELDAFYASLERDERGQWNHTIFPALQKAGQAKRDLLSTDEALANFNDDLICKWLQVRETPDFQEAKRLLEKHCKELALPVVVPGEVA